jgi:hypothetical protein
MRLAQTRASIKRCFSESDSVDGADGAFAGQIKLDDDSDGPSKQNRFRAG